MFPVAGRSGKTIDKIFPVSEKNDKMFPNSNRDNQKGLKSDFVSLD